MVTRAAVFGHSTVVRIANCLNTSARKNGRAEETFLCQVADIGAIHVGFARDARRNPLQTGNECVGFR
jgi:hypothetical protein